MRVLCIDLSLHCGFAFMVDGDLKDYGTIHYDGPSVREMHYPASYVDVAEKHITTVLDKLLSKHQPDVIVIEETNKGKNRYSQKMLEFLHHQLLLSLKRYPAMPVYLDTSHWRSVLGIWMSKEQKKINAKINKAKREGGDVKARETKKALGVRGKFNKKHVAIAHANATFGLQLKVKDNDAADAICLGLAYFKGATPSNGI